MARREVCIVAGLEGRGGRGFGSPGRWVEESLGYVFNRKRTGSYLD